MNIRTLRQIVIDVFLKILISGAHELDLRKYAILIFAL